MGFHGADPIEDSLPAVRYCINAEVPAGSIAENPNQIGLAEPCSVELRSYIGEEIQPVCWFGLTKNSPSVL